MRPRAAGGRDGAPVAGAAAGRFASPLACAALLAGLAAALRLPPMFSELWLDEVWSLAIAREARDVLSLFRDFADHHHLNTLVAYLLGEREGWIAYRVHSLLAGVATVVIGHRIAGRHGPLEGWVAGLLLAISYPLVHFSSELRGYALAVAFALAGWLAAANFLDTRRWRWAMLLWVSVPLGLLSHLTALHGVVAVGTWALWRLWREAPARGAGALDAARLLAVPAVLAAAAYLLVFRHMFLGSGAASTPLQALAAAASLAGGGPEFGPVAPFAAAAALAFGALAVAWAWRRGRGEWLVLAIGIFVSQVVIVGLRPPAEMAVRHFLVSIAFALVGAAGPLAEWLARAGWRRLAAAALIGVFVAGNAVNLVRLYEYGRGGQLAALRRVVEHAGGERVTLSGGNDFQYRMLIGFYARYLRAPPTLAYVDDPQLPADGTEWRILHELGAARRAPGTTADRLGNAYTLDAIFPYAGLSGWHTYLYRRAAAR